MPRSHADVQQPLELEPQAAGSMPAAPAPLAGGFSPAAVQALQRSAGNQERLEHYIRARNSGRTHHHH
jgi:hypothetical protein